MNENKKENKAKEFIKENKDIIEVALVGAGAAAEVVVAVIFEKKRLIKYAAALEQAGVALIKGIM